MKTFAKKPLNGGIPATEKKISTKEKAQRLFDLKKFDKLDKNRGVDVFPLKLFTWF